MGTTPWQETKVKVKALLRQEIRGQRESQSKNFEKMAHLMPTSRDEGTM